MQRQRHLHAEQSSEESRQRTTDTRSESESLSLFLALLRLLRLTHASQERGSERVAAAYKSKAAAVCGRREERSFARTPGGLLPSSSPHAARSHTHTGTHSQRCISSSLSGLSLKQRDNLTVSLCSDTVRHFASLAATVLLPA